jgi:hypothetical protein
MSRLLLAPMEGLVDDVLRDVLTRVGGYDLAVSEFIRVSGNLLPPRSFSAALPGTRTASRTRAGTPLVVQLLGSDPACLADNAAQLVELAPAGIDLNFGCPAPTVNRHGGGATLLADPEQLLRIVAAVRRVVPAEIPFYRQDAARRPRYGEDAGLRAGAGSRRYRRLAGRACAHPRRRLSTAGALGVGRAHPRGGIAAGGRQRRGMDGCRLRALPCGEWQRRRDDRPRRRRRSFSRPATFVAAGGQRGRRRSLRRLAAVAAAVWHPTGSRSAPRSRPGMRRGGSSFGWDRCGATSSKPKRLFVAIQDTAHGRGRNQPRAALHGIPVAGGDAAA